MATKTAKNAKNAAVLAKKCPKNAVLRKYGHFI